MTRARHPTTRTRYSNDPEWMEFMIRKHVKIMALDAEGKKQKEIAQALRLKHHTSVLHHLHNYCKCVARYRVLTELGYSVTL